MDDRKTVRLTGAEVCHIVAEYAALKAGIRLPVQHAGRWLLRDGSIELELELSIESVPNVRKLDTIRILRGRKL